MVYLMGTNTVDMCIRALTAYVLLICNTLRRAFVKNKTVRQNTI